MYKIGFVGLPSSGKTTAATNLNKALVARNIKTAIIPEFARDYMRAKGDRIRTGEEQIRCSQIQSDLESRALETNPEVMITDTPVFITQAYTQLYYPHHNLTENHRLSNFHKYDTIFWCNGDTYQEDGVRFQTKQELQKLDGLLKNLIETYQRKPVITIPTERNKRINFLDSVAKELEYGIRYNSNIIIG